MLAFGRNIFQRCYFTEAPLLVDLPLRDLLHNGTRFSLSLSMNAMFLSIIASPQTREILRIIEGPKFFPSTNPVALRNDAKVIQAS